MVDDLVWTTHPINFSSIKNGDEGFKTGENMGGAVQWFVAEKFD